MLIFPVYSNSYNFEQPLVLDSSVSEKPSPSDWVEEGQIKVYNDRVVIEIEGAEWAKFTDTNSMDPVIDDDANAIEVVPKSFKQINEGDIISYEIPQVNGTIIHRVIETGVDSEGWYAITKGDNLDKQDPYKIRFDNIRRIVVAIVY